MDIHVFLPKTELFERNIEISEYLATKLIKSNMELVLP